MLEYVICGICAVQEIRSCCVILVCLCIQAGSNRPEFILLDQDQELRPRSRITLLAQCVDWTSKATLRAQHGGWGRRCTTAATCRLRCHWLELGQFVEWEISVRA